MRNTDWGWSKFIKLNSLFTEDLLEDDELIVCCDVSYAIETKIVPSQESRIKPECACRRVSDELYASRMLPDVVFTLNAKDFPAHRAVLALHSPVLKTMFEMDHEEGKESRIIITDMSEDLLENLLRFAHTGKAASPDNMKNLWKTIDKHARRR